MTNRSKRMSFTVVIGQDVQIMRPRAGGVYFYANEVNVPFIDQVLWERGNSLTEILVRMGMGMSTKNEKSDGVSLADGYDVFMSFRGPDSRQGLGDCLYHVMQGENIHVFRDEEELRVGNVIRHKLRRAIKNSKIYVPIFSENYASSPACLHELAYMVKCMKSKPFEKMILPIFCGVEPRDVMLKTELYVGALAKHEEKFGRQTKRAWADGLRSVAQIKGMELKEQGYWKFTHLVTQEIQKMLKEQTLSVRGSLTEPVIQKVIEEKICVEDRHYSVSRTMNSKSENVIIKTFLKSGKLSLSTEIIAPSVQPSERCQLGLTMEMLWE